MARSKPAWQRSVEDIPILGDILSDAGRSDEDVQQESIEEQRSILEQGTFSPGDVSPTYDYEYVTPDMLLGDSQRGWAYADQDAVNAQYDALDQLEKWGQGNLTDVDMNNMRLAQMDNARAERGAREATMQQMQARGMGGSGAELAGILGGQQGMANANNAAGLSMQIAAQDRALRAIEGAGNLSSGIRQSSFNEAYGRGSAIDEFNQANTSYQQGVQQRNTDRTNAQEDGRVSGNESIYGQLADMAGVDSNIKPGLNSFDRWTQFGTTVGKLSAGGG